MSGWAIRRFWKTAEVVEADKGFGIQLDARPLLTPGKVPLVVPTRAMAEALVMEWEAQEEVVRPQTMPVTRAANTAIDNVARTRAAVAEVVAAYGESDLICYRAERPPALRAWQAVAWDPLLRWAEMSLGARLISTEGVIFVPQPSASLAALRAKVEGFDPFRLTALHDLVTLSGSLVIGLAVAECVDEPEALWSVSRLDEEWQIEQWGEDDEARAEAELKRQAFLAAERFFRLCGSGTIG